MLIISYNKDGGLIDNLIQGIIITHHTSSIKIKKIIIIPEILTAHDLLADASRLLEMYFYV